MIGTQSTLKAAIVPGVRLLTAPYHLGRERVGMGKGPDRFIDAGVIERARDRGFDVDSREVRRPGRFSHEIGGAFGVLRAHARQVRASIKDGRFPLTLAGNCITAAAMTAALGEQERLGVVWFDAHGDANTPATTPSGFLDGMALATVAGWCWASLAATVPGFQPVPESQMLLAAPRSLDERERRLLGASKISVVAAAEMRTATDLDEAFLPRLHALTSRVDRVYVHLDLDAIDLADGRANEFSVSGGPTLDALTRCLEHVADSGNVVAASLTSYNPDCDDDANALRAGLRLLDALLRAASP